MLKRLETLGNLNRQMPSSIILHTSIRDGQNCWTSISYDLARDQSKVLHKCVLGQLLAF
jgi:hypothetical protein